MRDCPPSPIRPCRALPWLAALATLASLAGCNVPGLGPDPRVAQREAEAQAIGGACRHALRGLEDCYALNPKAPKAAIFAGWKDMDVYMRDNKIEGTPSVLSTNTPPKADEPAEAPAPGKRGHS